MLKVFCASCESQILPNELAVLIAYVLVSDSSNFAVRTTDLFHHRCWNEGATNGATEQSADQPPPAPPL